MTNVDHKDASFPLKTKLLSASKDVKRILLNSETNHHQMSPSQRIKNNPAPDDRPPSIGNEEAACCKLIGHYKHRLEITVSADCIDWGLGPYDVKNVFCCTSHSTDLTPADLWRLRDTGAHLFLE